MRFVIGWILPEFDALRRAMDAYDEATQGGYLFKDPDVYERPRIQVITAARRLLERLGHA